jgi:hypothetical protein
MISELLALALKAGIVAQTARRVFWWAAAAAGLVAIVVGTALGAICFAGVSVFLALADPLTPAGAAAAVAAGLLCIGAALAGMIWYRVRPRIGAGATAGTSIPSATDLAASIPPIPLVLLALGAGLVAGNTIFKSRDR